MITNIEDLTSIADKFSSKGLLFDAGCDTNNIDKYIAICISINPEKNICTVKDWQWWDLDVDEEAAEIYAETGSHPCLIKSDCVIEDQAGRYKYKEWVRSSLLSNFSHNCIFETSNTFYILVGKGSRKKVSLDVVRSIF